MKRTLLAFPALLMFGGCVEHEPKPPHFYASTSVVEKKIQADPKNTEAMEALGLIALGNNDTEEAKRRFKQALENRSWLWNHWPFSMKTTYRLAMTALREDDFAEASRLFYAASGKTIESLTVRGKQLALFEGVSPYVIAGNEQTQVDFIIRDPLPVVSVSINGQAPVNFFIDTGAEEIVLDTEYAAKINANIVGSAEGEYAGGVKGMTGFGMIDTLSVGGIQVKNIPVQTIDLKPTQASIFNGIPIQGVIGTRFLMHFLPTIDYKHNKLVLRQKGSEASRRFLDDQKEVKRIPFYLAETHLILAEGSFNGVEGLFFIDTGLADAGIHAPKKTMQKAGVAMHWDKAETGAGGGGMVTALKVDVDTVTLGRDTNQIVRNHLTGVVFEDEMSLFNGDIGYEITGLISHEFFLDTALTLDFDAMEMVVE